MDESQRRDFFRNRVAMAPMATGGNLPYRRLCRQFGAVRTCSEMILAHKLVKGGDRPLLRHHSEETDFGVQLAGKQPEVMAEAARIALDHGAVFLDLNFGCPIDLVVKRGSGAALLKRPQKLATIVAAVRAVGEMPLTVKIRLGYSREKINCVDIARRIEDAGGDAVVVHGRTRNQRYRLSADWDWIDQVAEAVAIPVIGNGDLLTCWDLRRRRQETGASSFLVARGALIKPWIFQELAEDRPLDPGVGERWRMMRRYFDLACEHFGDDEKGLGRVQRFCLWHLKFWHRFYPWTEADFLEHQPDSLLQARSPQVGGDTELELLTSSAESDHETIWQRLLAGDHPS